MEGRNYITPCTLKQTQNLIPLIGSIPPVHYSIGDCSTVVHYPEMQSILIENQRLVKLNEFFNVELSAAKNDLHHLRSAADKMKAERDAAVGEVFDRAVKMEAELRTIDESNAELAQVQGDLQKLRREKKELEEKLNKLHGDVENVSLESHPIAQMKAEIEIMQREIRIGREVIEQEKRVNASNIKEFEAMKNCGMFLVREIKRLQVEVKDAVKRVKATAGVEAALISG